MAKIDKKAQRPISESVVHQKKPPEAQLQTTSAVQPTEKKSKWWLWLIIIIVIIAIAAGIYLGFTT